MSAALSNLADIKANTIYQTNNYSFVDRLGSFVNNERFKKGYDDFRRGKSHPGTHVWEALSAIGNDIGEVIESNVLNYVDYVSNVDLCKVTSLNSMMKMLGFDYTIFDQVEKFPEEIVNLINVLSINKKYLMDSKRMKKEFIEAIRSSFEYDGTHSVLTKTDPSDIYKYSEGKFSFVEQTQIARQPGCERLSALYGEYKLSVDNAWSWLAEDNGLGSYYLQDDGVWNESLKIYVYREYVNENGVILRKFRFGVTDHNANETFASDDLRYLLRTFYGLWLDGKAIAIFPAKVVDRLDEISGADAEGAIAEGFGFEDDVNSSTGEVSIDFFDAGSYPDETGRVSDFRYRPMNVREFPMDEALIGAVTEAAKGEDKSETATDDDISPAIGVKFVPESWDFRNEYIQPEEYRKFVEYMFYNVIDGTLRMTYNDVERTPIYLHLGEQQVNADTSRGYYADIAKLNDDDFQNFKIKNGIESEWNHELVADAIERGDDELENYEGAKRELLEKVFDYRSLPLNSTINSSIATGNEYGEMRLDNSDFASGVQINQPQTRYSWYRRRKVLEYIDFVNNKFYADNPLAYLKTTEYDFDPNYHLIEPEKFKGVVYKDGGEMTINEDIVRFCVESLAKVTLYIAKLREKIKLQTRKNYMKGTNNLLTYVVNEFLIDYARSNRIFEGAFLSTDNTGHVSLSTLTPKTLERIQGIKEVLSANDINNVAVVEYVDGTDYYNIETVNSEKAGTDSGMAERYWENASGADGIAFSLEEIDRFYLSTLNLADKNNDFSSSGAINFLSLLYDIGADDGYVDPEDGIFHSRLSHDLLSTQYGNEISDIYTDEIYAEYVTLSNTYLDFKDDVLSTYSYPNDTLSNQISNVLEEHIFGYLSDQYLSAISANWDKYHGEVEAISSDTVLLSSNYQDFLSGEYQFYLKKNDCKYSYEEDDPEGVYKHDGTHGLGNYFLDNFDFYNGEFLEDKLKDLQEFVDDEDNIRNYAILDTVSALMLSVFTEDWSISGRFISEILNGTNYDGTGAVANEEGIRAYGFLDIHALTMDSELTYAYDFLQDAVQKRLDYLMSIVNSVKTQTNNLLASYNSVNQTFELVLSQYDTKGDENYKLGVIPSLIFGKGAKGCEDGSWTTKACSDCASYYDKWSQTTYYEKEGGKYHSAAPSGAGTDCSIDANDTLETKVDKLNTWMNQETGLIMTSDGDGGCIIADYHYQVLDTGVGESLKAVVQSLNELRTTYNTIIAQVAVLGIDTDKEIARTTSIFTDIQTLQEFVNTKIDTINFNTDSLVQIYHSYIEKIISLSSDYLPYKEEFEGITSNSDYSIYLAGYIPSRDFTLGALNKLITFADKKDAANRETMYNEVDSMLSNYYNIQDDLLNLVDRIAIDIEGFYPQSDKLEEQVQNVYDDLLKNIEDNRISAQEQIDEIKLSVYSLMDVISSEISGKLSTDENFDDAVNGRLAELNFFEHSRYLYNKGLHLTYGGKEICYDPYYNHKNTVHSSYQIHPFLWNFVEALGYGATIGKAFSNVLVKELEAKHVSECISKYIGPYGNVINEAYNDIHDYSGYVTRYESSNHATSDSTVVNYVIDYDGAFYPPAIEDLFAGSTSSNYAAVAAKRIQTIVAANPAKDSFYEKYYSHLHLEAEERLYIANQLTRHLSAIYDITRNKKFSEVYDIYKYGLDLYKNSYILYKRYAEENPSWKHKRDTLGELWIRKSNHPIAFPAFGKDPAVDYEKTPDSSMLGGANLYFQYADMATGKDSDHIYGGKKPEDNYRLSSCFYDFDFTESGNAIALFSKFCGNLPHGPNGLPLDGKTGQIDQFDENTMETPTIIVSRIFDSYDEEAGRNKLKLQNCSYEDSDYPASEIIEQRAAANGQRKFRYIGSFSGNNSRFKYFVFAGGRMIYRDGRTNLDIRIVQYDTNASNRVEYAETTKQITIPGQLDGGFDGFQAASSFYNGTLTLAFLTVLENKTFSTFGGGANVKPYENSVGADFTDPVSEEFNSYDVFEQNVVVQDYKVSNGAIDDMTSERTCNMAADMSYVPSFAGHGNETKIYSNDPSADHYCFELLGMSKDIEEEIAMVNTEADPYFDYASIYKNYTFGRVYEDWLSSYDKTLLVVENPILNTRDPANPGTYSNSITWEIDLNNELRRDGKTVKFDRIDYKRMSFVFYNKTKLGKNPYFVCNLRDVTVDTLAESQTVWFDAYYLTEAVTSEAVIEGGSLIGGASVRVGGTYDCLGGHGSTGSNSIDNISNIKLNFCSETGFLRVVFEVQDVSRYAYVEKDSLQMVFCNDKDLETFRYYHMFDMYGAICSKQWKFENHILSDMIQNPPIARYARNSAYRWPTQTGTRPYGDNPDGYTAPYGNRGVGFELFWDRNCFTEADFKDKFESIYNVHFGEDPAKTLDVKFEKFQKELGLSVVFEKHLNMTRDHDVKELFLTNDYQPTDRLSAGMMFSLGGRKPAEGGRSIFKLNGQTLVDSDYLVLKEDTTVAGLTDAKAVSFTANDTIKYLKDINLKGYEFLSNVFVLAGYDKLQYKYDEELHFNIDDELYYYPTLNLKYPKSAGNFIKPEKLFNLDDLNTVTDKEKLGRLSTVFDESNLFILELDKPSDIAARIGKVEIPVTFTSSECIRVYEDYLYGNLETGTGEREWPGNEPGSGKLDPHEPETYKYVKFHDSGLPQGIDPDVHTAIYPLTQRQLVMQEDDFLDEVYGLSNIVPAAIEAGQDKANTEYIPVDVAADLDLKNLLKLYVNFRRETTGGAITLYFNYFNYIDTPYVKLDENGHEKIDVIPGTYLRLAAGENGVLNVMAQFKYFSDGKLYGYTNATLVSYRIYNLSDDKPKFLIKKIFEIEKDSLSRKNKPANVKLTVSDVDINADLMDDAEKAQTNYPVGFSVGVDSDKRMKAGNKFSLYYPDDMITWNGANTSAGFSVVEPTKGILAITLKTGSASKVDLGFTLNRKISDMLAGDTSRINKQYMVYAEDAEFYDTDGIAAKTTEREGIFRITSTTRNAIGTASPVVGSVEYEATGINVKTNSSPTNKNNTTDAKVLLTN